MIEIFNEIKFIKDVLDVGLSNKWYRDSKLLIRFYHFQGIKKSEVKNIIKNKLEVGHDKGLFTYVHDVNYKQFNKMFTDAWNDKSPLREINKVEVSKEVVDWFLSLPDNYEITDETKNYISKRRNKKLSNKPISWKDVKYLWTLYIWSKIQEQYKSGESIIIGGIDTKSIKTRLKEDADINKTFDIKKNTLILNDLGIIKMYRKYLVLDFVNNFDVFKIPITDKNKVIIEAGDAPNELRNEIGGDLYHPGYWLEKRKMGSFVCANCGREFAYLKKYTTGRKQKYCEECAESLKNNTLNGNFKIIQCIDCGKDVKIKNKDTKTCRCIDCQDEQDRKLAVKYMKKYRENQSS